MPAAGSSITGRQLRADLSGLVGGSSSGRTCCLHVLPIPPSPSTLFLSPSALHPHPPTQLVYLDVELQGQPLGRIEAVLFTDVSPRAAENFRRACGPLRCVGGSGWLSAAAGWREGWLVGEHGAQGGSRRTRAAACSGRATPQRLGASHPHPHQPPFRPHVAGSCAPASRGWCLATHQGGRARARRGTSKARPSTESSIRWVTRGWAGRVGQLQAPPAWAQHRARTAAGPYHWRSALSHWPHHCRSCTARRLARMQFIDQTGVETESVFGGQVRCRLGPAGGIELQHRQHSCRLSEQSWRAASGSRRQPACRRARRLAHPHPPAVGCAAACLHAC